MRSLAALLAVALPLQAMAAVLPDRGGPVVVICTAEGPRTMTLDAEGKPVSPSRRDMPACAHLWCEGRRPRPGGSYDR